MQLRQILRRLGSKYNGKAKIRELLDKKLYRLKQRDYDILAYAYIEKLSVENIRNKLGMSESHYHNALNIALEKLEALITDAEHRELIELI